MTQTLTTAQDYFNSGNLEKAEEILVNLLKSNIDNAEYRILGEKILRKKQEIRHQKISEKRKNIKSISTEKFSCPNCGANIEIFSEESETVTCKKCRAVIDLESDENSLAFTLNKFYKTRPREQSFLKLGLILSIKGKKHQIIGRSKKKIVGREWDSEDSRYASYSWKYDEWVLLGEKKEILYLSEDSEGYKISQSFVPKKPMIPEDSQVSLNLDGNFSAPRITERGLITTMYVEGEFPWRLQAGDFSHFAESGISKWGKFLGNQSVEWKIEKKSGKIQEVEFFKTEKIKPDTLLKSIDEESDSSGKIKAIKQKFLEKLENTRHKRMWGWIFVATAVFLLFFSLYNSGNGKKILSESLSVSGTGSEKLLGPLDFDTKGEVYTIKLRSNVRGSNNWNWSSLTLLNGKKLPVNQITGDFWSESGRDSEGSWSESNSSTELVFYIENPGKYFLSFSGEGGNVSGSVFHVDVYKDTPLARHYFYFAIFSGIMGLLILWKNQNSAVFDTLRRGGFSTEISTSNLPSPLAIIIIAVVVLVNIVPLFLS